MYTDCAQSEMTFHVSHHVLNGLSEPVADIITVSSIRKFSRHLRRCIGIMLKDVAVRCSLHRSSRP